MQAPSGHAMPPLRAFPSAGEQGMARHSYRGVLCCRQPRGNARNVNASAETSNPACAARGPCVPSGQAGQQARAASIIAASLIWEALPLASPPPPPPPPKLTTAATTTPSSFARHQDFSLLSTLPLPPHLALDLVGQATSFFVLINLSYS